MLERPGVFKLSLADGSLLVSFIVFSRVCHVLMAYERLTRQHRI